MCANPLLCLLSPVAVAFHSPPVTIKKEPQSPGSDPSQSCSHKQSFSYPSGEQCLYARYLQVAKISVLWLDFVGLKPLCASNGRCTHIFFDSVTAFEILLPPSEGERDIGCVAQH